MVTELRPSPTQQRGVSRTCTHCGGQMFLDTDPHDRRRNPYFWNCINCARHTDTGGTDIRQPAEVITPRSYPIPGRRRQVRVGSY